MPTCPSQVWTHFDSSSGSDGRDFFSPCHSYFSTRYAIGTHTAKRESMELFTSKHGNYRYVSVIKKMKIVYLIPWTSFVVW